MYGFGALVLGNVTGIPCIPSTWLHLASVLAVNSTCPGHPTWPGLCQPHIAVTPYFFHRNLLSLPFMCNIFYATVRKWVSLCEILMVRCRAWMTLIQMNRICITAGKWYIVHWEARRLLLFVYADSGNLMRAVLCSRQMWPLAVPIWVLPTVLDRSTLQIDQKLIFSTWKCDAPPQTERRAKAQQLTSALFLLRLEKEVCYL